MSISEWATTISGGLAIAGAIGFFLRLWVRHELQTMRIIKHEFTNNGGSSMKDKVDLNTERLTRVEARVDDIYRILCERNN